MFFVSFNLSPLLRIWCLENDDLLHTVSVVYESCCFFFFPQIINLLAVKYGKGWFGFFFFSFVWIKSTQKEMFREHYR